MNKKLPFEEAFERQINNLSSANEDESWQKMKQLLDENDKNKPFLFYKTSKLTIILILVLLTGFWLINREKKTIKEKPVAATDNNVKQQKSLAKNTRELPNSHEKTTSYNSLKSGNASKKPLYHQLPVNSAPNKNVLSKPAVVTKTKETVHHVNHFCKKSEITKKNIYINNQTNTAATNAADTEKTIIALPDNTKKLGKLSSAFKKNDGVNLSAAMQPVQKSQLSFYPKDTSARKEDTLPKNSAAMKTISLAKNKKYFLSAGAGVQQQIPLAGQKAVGYGYNAKNALSDYIPSVYVRLERDRKWFLQGEFIYNAPQLIKEFSYSRQTLASDSGGTVTTTALNLKKAFFNKIPVTFNYYIRPHLSAGVGAMYSLFHGAIAEKETTTKSTQTNAESVVSQVVPITGYTDSFLYKSHVYLLVQTNYSRGRFSAGVRYTKDIQPYIKYTLPDGTITNKKNYALEFILRFRLWKSAKF